MTIIKIILSEAQWNPWQWASDAAFMLRLRRDWRNHTITKTDVVERIAFRELTKEDFNV